MEEELGYGNPGEMGMSPDAELAGQAPAEEEGAGGELEAMIAEGVQAFMESQDPEIAVQVVMMLAESMGLAGGGGDPMAGGADPMAGGGGAPSGGGMPMAKHGGKFGFFNADRAGEFMKFVSK
jgi:hypothetical protein